LINHANPTWSHLRGEVLLVTAYLSIHIKPLYPTINYNLFRLLRLVEERSVALGLEIYQNNPTAEITAFLALAL